VPNQLTPEDYEMVNLATRHECYTHRHWPHEVLRAIVGAEVIPPAHGQHRAAQPAGRRLRGIRLRLRLSRLRSRPAPCEDLAVSA
jgi:hypothetical protein